MSGVISRLQSTQSPAPGLATSRGIVTSVDPVNGVVTIRHQPIRELAWPAMTMRFKLAQPGMTRGLRKGLRVRFAVETQPRGNNWIIDRIAPDPAQ